MNPEGSTSVEILAVEPFCEIENDFGPVSTEFEFDVQIPVRGFNRFESGGSDPRGRAVAPSKIASMAKEMMNRRLYKLDEETS